jgi:predicted esterase
MWTAARIQAFASGGGDRVIFGCGQRGCVAESTPLSKQLTSAGVASRVYFAPVGHSIDRPLQERIRPDFGWLVEGDARWGR